MLAFALVLTRLVALVVYQLASTMQLTVKEKVVLMPSHIMAMSPPSLLQSYLATCRPIWSFWPSKISKM